MQSQAPNANKFSSIGHLLQNPMQNIRVERYGITSWAKQILVGHCSWSSRFVIS